MSDNTIQFPEDVREALRARDKRIDELEARIEALEQQQQNAPHPSELKGMGASAADEEYPGTRLLRAERERECECKDDTHDELTERLAEETDSTPEEIEQGFDIAPPDEGEVVGTGDADLRTMRQAVTDTIEYHESEYGDAAPIDYVHKTLREDYDGERVLEAIDQLREQGEIYEPQSDHLKVV